MLRWILSVWLGLESWWGDSAVPEKEGGYIDPSGLVSTESITGGDASR